MTQWPRTIAAAITTPPVFPPGMESWSPSGKAQTRAFSNVGRMWQETFAAFDMQSQAGRALIQAINQALREKTLWDIQPAWLKLNYGSLGGSPSVSGATQTGSTLLVSGAPVSTANWLRRGDIIQISGLQLIYDVAADVITDSAGHASVSISPPIFSGGSPANGAFVQTNASLIFLKAILTNVEMPMIDQVGVAQAGMVLHWREQPS